MATPKTATKGGNSISDIESLDLIMKLYAIGACPDALFFLIISPPGCGKTSWMRAHASEESFLINGKVYGENTAAIPIVQSPFVTMKQYLAARKTVKALLDEEDRTNETLVERLTEYQIRKDMERDIHMRPPRYFELENFLLRYDKEKYDPKRGNVPIIWVDEATQMSVEARDQLITALVDGELLRELKIGWKPMVIMLANGRAFGGQNNFPLSPRQVARCIQMIFVPEGSEDIPMPTLGLNTYGSKKLRQEYHKEVIDGFRAGKNALSAAELPKNHPGNPRAQNILLWFVERIRALKLHNPLELMKVIINGFIASDYVLEATEMVREYFTNLPASLEEIRDIITGPHDGTDPTVYKDKIKKKFGAISKQEWMTWAKFRSDGTPQGQHDIGLFLMLLGMSKDLIEAINLQTAPQQ